MNKLKGLNLGVLISIWLIPCLLLAATPTGQLGFSAPQASSPIQISSLPEASRYALFQNNLINTMDDGPAAWALIRQFDATDKIPVINSVFALVKRAIDPEGKWKSVREFIADSQNEWVSPIIDYILGVANDKGLIYLTVNYELRDTGTEDSEFVSEWTGRMREAMYRIPRFEGISFRGTRLTAEQAERYYPLGELAQDPAFVSTSLSVSMALKFADPRSRSTEQEETTALIFVVLGKTGRPIFNFATGLATEYEVLFANGTPMKVLAKTPVFYNEVLKKTQIIILEEN